MIRDCGGQVRCVEGGAYAWDFSAVLQMGALLGAPLPRLADLLPRIEDFVLFAWRRET